MNDPYCNTFFLLIRFVVETVILGNKLNVFSSGTYID